MAVIPAKARMTAIKLYGHIVDYVGKRRILAPNVLSFSSMFS